MRHSESDEKDFAVFQSHGEKPKGGKDEQHANSNNRSTVGRFVRKGQRADEYFEELFAEGSKEWSVADRPMGTPADHFVYHAERFASERAWLDFGDAVKNKDQKRCSALRSDYMENKSETLIFK